jgi:hypothetical protein
MAGTDYKRLLEGLGTCRWEAMRVLADAAEDAGDAPLAAGWRWLADNQRWPNENYKPFGEAEKVAIERMPWPRTPVQRPHNQTTPGDRRVTAASGGCTPLPAGGFFFPKE